MLQRGAPSVVARAAILWALLLLRLVPAFPLAWSGSQESNHASCSRGKEGGPQTLTTLDPLVP